VLAIADDIGASPGQGAIAWAMDKGVFPIVGPRTPAQLRDNLAAAALELDADHIRRLDEVSAVAAGYPHELLAVQNEHLLPYRSSSQRQQRQPPIGGSG